MGLTFAPSPAAALFGIKEYLRVGLCLKRGAWGIVGVTDTGGAPRSPYAGAAWVPAAIHMSCSWRWIPDRLGLRPSR